MIKPELKIRAAIMHTRIIRLLLCTKIHYAMKKIIESGCCYICDPNQNLARKLILFNYINLNVCTAYNQTYSSYPTSGMTYLSVHRELLDRRSLQST